MSEKDKSEIFNRLNELCISFAEMRKDMEHLISGLPVQPCRWHLELDRRVQSIEAARRQSKRDWREAAFRMGEKLFWAGLVGALAYMKGVGSF